MKSIRQPFLTTICWALFVAWMCGILWLSSLQPPEIMPVFEFVPGDKVAHFVAFATGGALLWVAAIRTFRRAPAGIATGVIAFVALFGVVDEWRQTYTPNRSGADVWDWCADALGAAFGVLLCLFIHVAKEGR